MERILLIGAGSLAFDILEFSEPKDVAARLAAVYVDPGYAPGPDFHGFPVVTDWSVACHVTSHYLLGISNIEHRERMRKMASRDGLKPTAPVLCRDVRIARNAEISAGCFIGPFSLIGNSARIGEDSLILQGICLGHDTLVGENVVVCPAVNIGGYAKVESQTFVGGSAVISPRVSIGAGSFVAAGAACLRDAPPGSFLVGNPAKRIADPGMRP